jgi:hypothetical protein
MLVPSDLSSTFSRQMTDHHSSRVFASVALLLYSNAVAQGFFGIDADSVTIVTNP